MTQNSGVGVAQASMPKVDANGESDGCGSGGVGVHAVKLVRTITSVKHHPGTGVLHRKTNTVKFNSNRILMSKTTNRD